MSTREVIIFIFLFVLLGATTFVRSDEYFSVRIHDGNSGSVRDVQIGFDLLRDDLDSLVFTFCEEYKVQATFCKLLYDKVAEAAAVVQRESSGAIPNDHLSRYASAIQAEHSRLYGLRQISHYAAIERFELEAIAKIIPFWQNGKVESVVVIHSCVLPDSSDRGRILLDILAQLRYYKADEAVDQMVVLNFGDVLPLEVLAALPVNGVIVQVHSSTEYFEIASLRILHALSQHMESARSNSSLSRGRVLYLHTKGASYAQEYQQILDWRDMMLYFLAGRHSTCSHLLLSGEVDCIGTNYKSDPRRIFSGNFWWCTSSHLASLAPLQHASSAKYEAESWVLERSDTRIYVLHGSNVNHAVVPYPALCYTEQRYHVLAYSSVRENSTAGANDAAPQERVDAMCGGPQTAREQRKFWKVL